MSRAFLDKQPGEVAAMFDGVAARYDRANSILSLGQDRFWRRATRQALHLRPGQRCLDLAAGTGASTQELARSGAYVVGLDISLGMLARGRISRPDVALLAADALALPFRDEVFDAVTISFGLRNVADPAAALRELARVTRPGGRLVVCEFTTPLNQVFRWLYQSVALPLLPAMARAVSSNPAAYIYLGESIRAWPDQAGLAGMVASAGWERVGWRNLTGGVVAIHRATRHAA